MQIGSKIRLHRIKKNMTQEELADGIISVSYLSKIENNQTIASDEVMEFLCQRLDIDYIIEEDDNIRLYCNRWFKQLLEARDMRKIKQIRQLMLNYRDKLYNNELSQLIELHMIRYYLLNKQINEAKIQIKRLEKMEKAFSAKEKYYWYKFNGNYYYVIQHYEQADFYYREAETWLQEICTHRAEQADLFYSLALTSSKRWHSFQAMYYGERALEIYRQEYHLQRCADCHITIGISARRTNQFKKALEAYEKAKKIAHVTDNKNIFHLYFQNFGYLYAAKNDSFLAIKYLQKSLEYLTEKQLEDKLITTVSIAKEYNKINDVKNTLIWLDKARSFITENSNQLYKFELEILQHSINGYGENFEQFMLQKVLPYVESHQLYIYVATYAKFLADYYIKQKKYKRAAEWLEHSIASYQNIVIFSDNRLKGIK